MKKIILSLSIVTLLLSAQPCFGQDGGGAIGETVAPTIYQKEYPNEPGILPTFSKTGDYGGVAKTEDVLDVTIVKFINLLSNIFIGFSVLFIIVAGMQYVLAQGDEEKIKKSHRSVAWAVLGIILIMLSYGIVYIINTLF